MKQEGSVLKAWLKLFDTKNAQSISPSEFCRGLRMLNFQGSVLQVAQALDADDSGAISLCEFDPASAHLWQTFRKWCLHHFHDVQDMMETIGGRHTWEAAEMSCDTLTEGIRRLGWVNEHPGDDEMISKALDLNDTGMICEQQLRWLTIEHRRMARKMAAKHAAKTEIKKYGVHDNLEQVRLQFKRFLKRRYGSFIRAWRCALCPHGSMNLQKIAFLKAVGTCGYNKDSKFLWRAFDKDESGMISIDELDLKSAEVLADFRNFVMANFKSSAAAFRALDMDGSRRVSYPEFKRALRFFDFTRPAKMLFKGLDRYCHGTIVEEDLKFLDGWVPLPFLTVTANCKAASDFKEVLFVTYRSNFKAWRRCLDVTMSNRCSFGEFEAGCKKVGFRGDVPGAWRALDTHLRGYIMLFEIDLPTAKILNDFHVWAQNEFGSVRSAFKVFDDDDSGLITLKEFVHNCHIYGYEGNAHDMFHVIDINRDKTLCYKELAFLEDFVIEEHGADDVDLVKPSGQEPGDSVEAGATKSRQQRWLAEKAAPKDTEKARQHLPPLEEASGSKQVEEFEPMNLVTIEMAEPLYALPPYKLAHYFRRRPSTTTSTIPLGIDSLGLGTDSFSQMTRNEQDRSSPREGAKSRWFARDGCNPWRRQTGMPTLDDLLHPIGAQPRSLCAREVAKNSHAYASGGPLLVLRKLGLSS